MWKQAGGLRILNLALLVTVTTLCAGCATGAGSDACDLIPLRVYDAGFNQRLAGEVETADAGAAWPEAVADYIALRDAVRACRNE